MERIRLNAAMVPFADKYEAAITSIDDAATRLRDAIDAGDAAAIATATEDLFAGLATYAAAPAGARGCGSARSPTRSACSSTRGRRTRPPARGPVCSVRDAAGSRSPRSLRGSACSTRTWPSTTTCCVAPATTAPA